jgi:nucleoside-diphosphate kinase
MGRIISRFEDKGLTVVGAKMIWVDRSLAERHYAEHKGKGFYEDLLTFITSAPVLVMAVRGKSAVGVCRKILGKTTGYEADPGTIRGDFGSSKSFNLVHGSDSPESAARELALYFADDELHEYERATAGWTVAVTKGVVE